MKMHEENRECKTIDHSGILGSNSWVTFDKFMLSLVMNRKSVCIPVLSVQIIVQRILTFCSWSNLIGNVKSVHKNILHIMSCLQRSIMSLFKGAISKNICHLLLLACIHTDCKIAESLKEYISIDHGSLALSPHKSSTHFILSQRIWYHHTMLFAATFEVKNVLLVMSVELPV